MGNANTLPVLFVAVLAGFAGPRVTAPHDRPANAPFVYTPPPAFKPARDEVLSAALGTAPEGMHKVWIFAELGAKSTPNITLTLTDKTPRVEESDLRDLALGMPAVFKQGGSTWTEVRHETRARADGTRVGLIEGETVRGETRNRVIQLVFPEDLGTALVTASFPSEDAAKWTPQIDATIDTATGVSRRVPPPAPWQYVGWGAAGGVLAYLALALVSRRKKATPKDDGDATAPPSKETPSERS